MSVQQSPNPGFPGAITSIKQEECGGEVLAVRFIDSKQALCDSKRPAEFTGPDHQTGSYKVAGFFFYIGCRCSSLPAQDEHLMPSHAEFLLLGKCASFLFLFFCLNACLTSGPVCVKLLRLRLCVCARVHVCVCVASAVNGPLRFPLLAVKEGNDL